MRKADTQKSRRFSNYLQGPRAESDLRERQTPRNCLETVAYEIEQAGKKMMETELRKLETQIKDSEQAILHRFSDATGKQMATLQEMAYRLQR